MPLPDKLLAAEGRLCRALSELVFAAPVSHVYNPLRYARRPHAQYLRRFAATPKRVIYLGMNPGPYGMAQTGVPFGEVSLVRGWMDITGPVERPVGEHPKRPVLGFECPRREVSGARLWGAVRERYPRAEDFFAHALVANYCPLVFLEASGRNRTPDRLPAGERTPLFDACDQHLRRVVTLLAPEWVVGIGRFATERAQVALAGRTGETGREGQPLRIGKVLHPSPASPAANQGWAGKAKDQLRAQGICRVRH